MAYEELFNRLKNYSNTTKAAHVKQATDFSARQSYLHRRKNAKKAYSSVGKTTRTIRSTIKKYSKGLLPEVEDIITESITDLTEFHYTNEASLKDIVNTNGAALIDDATRNVNENLSRITASVTGLPQATIDALAVDAAGYIDDIKSTINSVINGHINDFIATSAKDLGISTSQLKSLVSIVSGPLLPSPNLKLLSNSKVNYDFFKRDAGNASTSRYIQANIPTKTGKLAPNKDILDATPDGKILKPNLKFDTNTVKSFITVPDFKMPTLPSLSSLVPPVPKLPSMPSLPSIPKTPSLDSLKSMVDLGAIGKKFGLSAGLTPQKASKAISEPEPTADKSEYGKIQVKETKGGFVEINDDTPGNVRKVQQHPSGSYNSMLDDGSVHTKVTNDRQEITDGNWNIKTEKDKVEIIAGNEKIEIRMNSNRTINGNFDTSVDGTMSTLVKKKYSNDYRDDFEEKIGGNSLITVTGNSEYKIAKDLKEKIDGNQQTTVGGNLTIKVSGNVNINSSGKTTINSSGPATLSSSSVVNISAPSVKIG